jgi:TonB family protein
MRNESFAVSLAIHISLVGVVTLLSVTATSGSRRPPTVLIRPAVTRLVLPSSSARAVRQGRSGDSGGGDRSRFPTTPGAPPRVEARLFVPPRIVRDEQRTQLALPAGFEEVPQLHLPAGDENGKTGIPAALGLGPGLNGVGGVGEWGPGSGPGASVAKGPTPSPILAKPTKKPELVFKTEPEYSDAARKSRQQGTVILAVEVGTDGRAHNIRVVKGLGAGLDERAIDAVNRWRFRPALANGRPVAVPITIEVNFRLL